LMFYQLFDFISWSSWSRLPEFRYLNFGF